MTTSTYQQQLRHLIRSMSMPNRESRVAGSLASVSTPDRVKLFVDGNLEKRLDKLQAQLSFVAEIFTDFDDLIVEFIRAEPLAAFGSAVSDGDAMLRWLLSNKEVTPEQRDYISCQQARHAIEEIARSNRTSYLRFQELASVAGALLPQLGTDPNLRIALNPTRAWATFETSSLLDDGVEAPANVLFFATRGEIATAALELEGQALLNELIDYQPCTLTDWSRVSAWGDRNELLAFCHDLVEIGLIAIS